MAPGSPLLPLSPMYSTHCDDLLVLPKRRLRVLVLRRVAAATSISSSSSPLGFCINFTLCNNHTHKFSYFVCWFLDVALYCLMALAIVLNNFIKKLNIVQPQITNPIITEIFMFLTSLWIGGKIANPAHTNDPNTVTTAHTSDIAVHCNSLRTERSDSTMKTVSKSGNAAFAPEITVAMAKKKDKVLNTQNKRRL
ncbi:hypothetical protein BDL97_18G050600 [Sphagnum fallax]|nr:hypothetical protein BDL97_18G050600 [Sphagnum fallax]